MCQKRSADSSVSSCSKHVVHELHSVGPEAEVEADSAVEACE